MLAKVIVIAILLGIVTSLGTAMIFLIRDRGSSTRMVKALTLRIGVSIALFILLFVMYALGFITPHGLIP